MVAEQRVYLDHAAGSRLRDSARQAWWTAAELVGNPAGLHGSARRCRAVLEDAREQLGCDLGAHPTEVVFTSGGSEADTVAVWGSIRARASERPGLVISAVEHPAVATAQNVWPDTQLVGVDRQARLDLDELASRVSQRTGLVSVQTVNNETGTVQPVDEAAAIAHRQGAWFHTDAVQAWQTPGITFADSPADLASLSAHKLGGPVGVGLLLVRRQLTVAATGLGGGQERGLRSGTQLTALAAGFAAAVREATEHREAEVARIVDHRRVLTTCLAQIAGARINGGDQVNPAIVHVTIAGVRADDVLLLLDRVGIDASVGSACRAGMHQPSEVVLAMTGSGDEALSSLRFSFGADTTTADLSRLTAALPGIIDTARSDSHLGGNA